MMASGTAASYAGTVLLRMSTARMPMPLAPCTSSNGRSPTNTHAAGSSSSTAAIAARNASGCGLVQGSSLEYTVPSIRSSTWSRTKHPSCIDLGHRVLESTPDPDAFAPQFAQQPGHVRVGERVRLPRLEVTAEQGLRHGHPGALEDVRERRALLPVVDVLPHGQFGLVDRAGHVRRLGLRIVLHADPVPEGFVIDGVPRGERPAPVENDRPDRHAPDPKSAPRRWSWRFSRAAPLRALPGALGVAKVPTGPLTKADPHQRA